MNTAVSVHDIYLARERLQGRIRRTPLVRSAWLSDLTGAEVWLKLESLQVSHAFKVRGAFNAVSHLIEAPAGRQSSPRPDRVVTASAGNHGQALAWAAREAGLTAVVFTPRDAARTKLDAIRRFGADLRAVATNYDEAEALAIAFAAGGRRGVHLALQPSRHRRPAGARSAWRSSRSFRVSTSSPRRSAAAG